MTTEIASGAEQAAPQPVLHANEIAGAREAWLAAGHDPLQFDGAARLDGVDTQPKATPEQVAHAADYGLSETPSPDDYNPNFTGIGATLSTERLGQISRETREFAAALRLPAPLGTAVIEYLVEIGPRLAAMSNAQKDDWHKEQYRLALELAGGNEDTLKHNTERAKAVLASADVPFSKALASTHAFHDAWLLATLANHGAVLDAWRKGRPK